MCRKDSNVEINDEVSRLISLLEKGTNTDDKTREDVRKLSQGRPQADARDARACVQ